MTTYRAGVYNADNNRPRQGPRDIAKLVREHDLDLLAVVEAAGYARALRARVRLSRTHRVFTGHGSKSRRDSMVIVRRGIRARKKRVRNLHTGGWERAPRNRRFGPHPGRHMVDLLIGPAGEAFRFGALHMPPRPHGEPGSEYAGRGAAFRAALDALEEYTSRWPRWALGTDFNAPWRRDDVYAWLRVNDADAVGHGIDFPVWAGIHVDDVHHVPAGGDHGHATAFTIHP